jgi:acid phosphatase family membrane protein YuiD
MAAFLYWFVGVAWVIAQTAKVIVTSLRSRRFMPTQFIKTGGMPSGHATLVSGLVTAIALDQGIGPLFYVTLGFSFIVLQDAIAPRLTRRHTPFQVTIGVLLGVGIVLLAYAVL